MEGTNVIVLAISTRDQWKKRGARVGEGVGVSVGITAQMCQRFSGWLQN